MERKEARDWIRTLIYNEVPVHPEVARRLHRDAGWEIPDHLRLKPILGGLSMEDRMELMRKLEQNLFGTGGDDDGKAGG